jgi:hypothetical protein
MQTRKNGGGHATCLRQRQDMTCRALRSRVESFNLCVMSGRKPNSQPKDAIGHIHHRTQCRMDASGRPAAMGHGVTNRDFHSACERVAAFVRAGCLSSRTQNCPRGGAASWPLIEIKDIEHRKSDLGTLPRQAWRGCLKIADADGIG